MKVKVDFQLIKGLSVNRYCAGRREGMVQRGGLAPLQFFFPQVRGRRDGVRVKKSYGRGPQGVH
jgi:hypothetical protein